MPFLALAPAAQGSLALSIQGSDFASRWFGPLPAAAALELLLNSARPWPAPVLEGGKVREIQAGRARSTPRPAPCKLELPESPRLGTGRLGAAGNAAPAGLGEEDLGAACSAGA